MAEETSEKRTTQSSVRFEDDELKSTKTDSTPTVDGEMQEAPSSVCKKGIMGAYRKLTAFLLEVHLHGSDKLSVESYNDLTTAVESICAQGEGEMFSVSAMFENGASGISETDGVGLLMNMGVQMKSVGRNRRQSVWTDTGAIEELVEDDAPSDAREIMMEAAFNCWEFCSKSSSERATKDIPVLMSIFEYPMDFFRRYHIEKDMLRRWIQAISDQYQDQPYHNWSHAFDVTQTLYSIMVKANLVKFLNYQDALALYCAAIAHDVGHCGKTNRFLTMTQHELAIRYNDKAPLENMHAACFFETLHKHDFISHTEKNGKRFSYDTFRSKVINTILATDMGQHMTFVDRFTARTANIAESPFMEDTKQDKEKSIRSKTDRRLLLEALLHTADLGHNMRIFDVNRLGVLNLEEEWFAQGDCERDLGMPISPNMDRSKDSVASTQPFFFQAFVRPLLDPWHAIIPEHIMVGLTNLDNNKKCWEEAVKKHGALPAPALLKAIDEEEEKKTEKDSTFSPPPRTEGGDNDAKDD